MINRRDFCRSMLAAPILTRGMGFAARPAEDGSQNSGGGFPLSNYTPYGYLDNPFHSWNLHRSGVIRSSPGIGYGFYFPAGPGGYFDFTKNGIYEAHLRLGFLINQRRFWTPEDFRAEQLTSPYHTKNLHTFAFTENSAIVESTFLQVDENSIAARLSIHSQQAQSIRVIAVLDCKLGGAAWWGRDGLVGNYASRIDIACIRSFAAGKVFLMTSDLRSGAHFIGAEDADLDSWLRSPRKIEKRLSYYPNPLRAALLFEVDVAANANIEHTIVMTRADNAALAFDQARESLGRTGEVFAAKHAEDTEFWSTAPQLEGDWPAHWKHGWVYDFETLRMMVRRPLGIYKHPWDAMQIQAPRTVLAESSIDMWALSYADPATAKEVVLGIFANAPSDGVPCSRENGEMNMVAADGSECGTSISWCYPLFCAASIWSRDPDRQWLSELYPLVTRFLRWTLENRTDADGFVIGKCSWETGMDTATRFLIEQPTGGEVIEFLRIVELQAATSQAAGVLAHFADVIGDTSSRDEWLKRQRLYAEKTQRLWKDHWFYDFDTRNGQLVTFITPDIGQVGPVFCGVASKEQIERMRPTLHKFFSDSVAGVPSAAGTEDWRDGLHWSSLVLPYIESVWSAGDLELASEVVHAIAERVYTSTDRRSYKSSENEESDNVPQLGWPGVSCEVWGAQGAYGGEGYGWGAVLPAHIIRNVVGFRDPEREDELPLSPNLPQSFMVGGRSYRIRNLHWRGNFLDLTLHALDSRRIRVEGRWSGPLRSIGVKDATGATVTLEGNGDNWHFTAANHQPYFMRLTGAA